MSTGRTGYHHARGRWLRRALAVSLVALGAVGILRAGALATHAGAPRRLPARATYGDAGTSARLVVRGSVHVMSAEDSRRLGASAGKRRVGVAVTVENATGEPLRGLAITAALDDALGAYLSGHPLTFGAPGYLRAAPADLVPGERPFVVAVDHFVTVPDPDTLPEAEREELCAALRSPIRLGVWWEAGEEFLVLSPEDIDYAGLATCSWAEPEPAS